MENKKNRLGRRIVSTGLVENKDFQLFIKAEKETKNFYSGKDIEVSAAISKAIFFLYQIKRYKNGSNIPLSYLRREGLDSLQKLRLIKSSSDERRVYVEKRRILIKMVESNIPPINILLRGKIKR